MRYDAAHKQRTRERIVAAASRRFRLAGDLGSGIATLMRDLKLTHGGFYKHFESKEHLFEEALAASVAEMGAHMEALAGAAAPGEALDRIIGAYLSDAHCEHPERGCPMAANGADISRLPRRSLDTCRRLLMGYASRLSPFMPGGSPAERERRAALLFSSMAGTLTLARTFTDAGERARFLEDARVFYARSARI